jgi:signal transduction histidine kinase
MIGRTMNSTLPEDRSGERDRLLARVARGEQIEQLETQRLRADGTVIDVSVSMAPLHGPDGSVIGVSAVTRDVSSQRTAEAERRALEDRLRQSERLESLGQLAGGIAHDFNNLLSLIINFTALALEDLDPEHPAGSYLEEVQRAGLSAARLTRQLLLFGKRDDTEAEPVDLAAILADVHELLDHSIGGHIELRIESDGNAPAVAIDRGQFEQILLNLTVNARDAMPDGGVITIGLGTAHVGEGPGPAPTGLRPGPYAELAVTDTGTGMSDEVVAHAFEPFFTTKATGEGTGLGLATIYGIVTKIGGTVEVHSELGLGTTFRLYLPATHVVDAGEGPAAMDGSRLGHGETVLVVEDEPATLDLTCHLLQRNGYAVVSAATAPEALDLMKRDPTVRLLLTDSVMPRLSGDALVEQARRVRPGLRVLYMSGHHEAGRDAHGHPVTRDDLLAKPFDEDTLLRKVADALLR